MRGLYCERVSPALMPRISLLVSLPPPEAIVRLLARTSGTNNQDATDEDDSQERQILKYFGRFGACLVGALAVVSIWFPSFDLIVRVIALTTISFGTLIVVRRNELRTKAVWMVVIAGAILHFGALWASRERLQEMAV